MSEDFLVPSTEIAHNLAVNALYMPMKIWPSQAGNVATQIGAIVTEEKNGIFEYLGLFVFDA